MEVLSANPYLAHLPCDVPTVSDVLRVHDLSINFRLKNGRESNVVKQVSFTIGKGEILGLLGESGSGKTTTALALASLLPSAARIVAGSVEFHGNNLYELEARRLREIRGAEISTIYQDSLVLNPVVRAGDQVVEVLRAHRHMAWAEMRDEVYATFATLGLNDCDRIFRAYPHQLSGGERRRVATAQALICQPQVVIADEPTAWLDSATTAATLAAFRRARDVNQTAFLLITHDPETLLQADRVMVMYAGQIVEYGSRVEVLSQPKHPYTAALLQCSDSGPANVGGVYRRLPYIPGYAPDPAETLEGCSFASRCSDRVPICNSRSPQFVKISGSRSVRCFKYGGES